MINKLGFCWGWRLGLMGCCLVWPIVFCGLVEAQSIREDTTLGAEGSVIDRNVQIRDRDSDRIRGGARRGGNLFHSFEQFDVDDGRGAYFDNPAGVENIFSRVTGNDASEIRGALGVIQAGSDDALGNANLFFMNPNGILFGPNSSLDVGGSFVGTTANAIGFGEEGVFSATNPQAVPQDLLQINPSAFLFNQINANANITNQSTNGLRVSTGQSLLLLGGDVSLNGGQLYAPSGRIELGGLAQVGVINLSGNPFQLTFPDGVGRSNVSAVNGSRIDTFTESGNGGSIAITANNINFSNQSNIFAGISAGLGSPTNEAGDIVVDGKGTVTLSDNSFITNIVLGIGRSGSVIVSGQNINLLNGGVIGSTVLGQGNAGNVSVEAKETITLSGRYSAPTGSISSGIFSTVASYQNFTGVGQGGDIQLEGRDIRLNDNAVIGTDNLSAQGTPGNIRIDLTGGSLNLTDGSGISASTTSRGNAGNILIQGGNLSLIDGSQIASTTNGAGNAGNITIRDVNSVDLLGTAILNGQVFPSRIITGTFGTGRAGDLTLTTGRLSIQGGAAVIASTTGSSGRAGNITINADSIEIAGSSSGRIAGISSQSETNSVTGTTATGDAGNVTVNTRTLSLQNGGTISTNTAGQGRGGNLLVTATESADLFGTAILNGQVFRSSLATGTFGSGRAGDLTLTTGRLSIQDGAAVTASTTGSSGRAGNITVNADLIEIADSSSGLLSVIGSQSETNSVTGVTATGDAGDVTVNTRTLSLQNGGTISTNTAGQGRGGNLLVTATESADLFGTATLNGQVSRSSLATGTFGSGRSGDLTLTTRQLSIRDGASIAASTTGSSGRAGNITVNADSVEITGSSSGLITGIGSQSEINPTTGATATGDAGDITVNTRTLSLQNGGTISTNTAGQGRGGNLLVTATESTDLFGTDGDNFRNSSLATGTFGSGKAGNLTLTTERLSIQDGAAIGASTFSSGEAGDVIVNADVIEISGISTRTLRPSGIVSASDVNNGVTATGDAGDVTVNTRTLSLQNGGTISTNTAGQGRGGNLLVTATESADLFGTAILNGQVFPSRLATGTFGSGRAGDLTLTTGRLSIQDGAAVTASAVGSSGRAGNITINADSIEIAGSSSGRIAGIGSESETNLAGAIATGDAGDVTVNTRTLSLQNGGIISTNTAGQGRGGNLLVTATESADLFGTAILNGQVFPSRLATGTLGSGRAGDLTLTTGRLSIQDGAAVTASTTGSSGRAGNITVNADSIEIAGSSSGRIAGISSQSEANLITGTTATGDAGDVTINTRTLSLQNGGTISTNTAGQGRGGNLLVTATKSTDLFGTATLNGQVFGSSLITGTSGSGRAGDLALTTDNLRIRGGAALIASTNGAGRAGNIRVEADQIILHGTSRNQPRRQQVSSGIGSETISRAEDAGNAGNIHISTEQLSIRDRAAISTTTLGQGNAGRIVIRNRGNTILSNNGNIGSNIAPGATGDGGTIDLRTRSLVVDGGQIAAVVSRQNRNFQNDRLRGGRGRGGNILVTAADEITLTGITRDGFSSGILTLSERGANGDAGNITIRTDDFRVSDGAVVVASTFNQGDGGDIEINATNFEAVNGGQVVTNTRDRGEAGTITLDVEDEIALSGTDPNFQNRRERARRYAERPNVSDRVNDVIVNQGAASGLFASTSDSSSGNGGSIDLNATNLSLSDRARISARSAGRGTAGDVQIDTQTLTATNSTLETAARRSSGGTIEVNPNDRTGRITLNNSTITTNSGDQGGNIRLGAEQILLRGNSDITTTSGGDGGNIDATAASIIAFDDSDILADSNNARGGNITLDTPAFFGSGYVPDQTSDSSTLDGNGRVDINASGSTASGTIRTPDTSFIQNSLTDLPDNSIDTDQLLANSCIVRDRDQPQGQFIITGADGFPDRPGSIALPDFPTGEIRNIPTDTEPNDQPWQLGDPVVEPQGVYRLPDGRLVMSRECDQ